MIGKRKRSSSVSDSDLQLLDAGHAWVPHIQDLFPNVRLSHLVQDAKAGGVHVEEVSADLTLTHGVVNGISNVLWPWTAIIHVNHHSSAMMLVTHRSGEGWESWEALCILGKSGSY